MGHLDESVGRAPAVGVVTAEVAEPAVLVHPVDDGLEHGAEDGAADRVEVGLDAPAALVADSHPGPVAGRVIGIGAVGVG